MKVWLVVGLGLVVAVVVGWWLGGWFLAQAWWPLSVSGREEIVVEGKLMVNEPGSRVGLVLVRPDGSRLAADLSHLPSQLTVSKLDRWVVARGSWETSNDPGGYLLVSWLK